MPPDDPLRNLRQSPRFNELIRKRLQVGTVLSAVMIGYYSAFYFCMAFFPEFMGRTLSDDVIITVGVYFGVSSMLLSVILSGYYTWWSINRYDVMKRKLLRELLDGAEP
jgi:uncharacterized membrane protein (DUF485 family)